MAGLITYEGGFFQVICSALNPSYFTSSESTHYISWQYNLSPKQPSVMSFTQFCVCGTQSK